MTVFNNILVASQVEEAAIRTLVKWMPTYLREIERQMETTVGVIPTPKRITNRNSLDVQAGEQYPIIIVITPGLEGIPVTDGGGVYTAVWRLGVAAAIAADSEEKANMWSKMYGAAIRAVIVKNQSLEGTCNATRWTDETYEDLPIENQFMNYRSASVFFTVECQNVLTRWGGPILPDDEPYVYGEAEEIIIDLVKENINA